MQETFVNLPQDIIDAITDLLSEQDSRAWISRAEILHSRYMEQERDEERSYVHDLTDVLAYLALRTPATYAQIYAAFLHIKELIPSWKPTSLLDIGSGPGTGMWATKTLFPTLQRVTCIDKNASFIEVGKEIIQKARMFTLVNWEQKDVMKGTGNSGGRYDIVIISNVLNELSNEDQQRLLNRAYALCKGVLLIIEPGTPSGSSIIQAVAKDFAEKTILVAPYINKFVQDDTYWLHFPQRFKRPEFQRRVRQHMREDALSASDWEETKYAYVAFGNIPVKNIIWGRTVGPIHKQKGVLEIPLLTENEIKVTKVMKRHKEQYRFAKDLRWGETIKTKEEIIADTTNKLS